MQEIIALVSKEVALSSILLAIVVYVVVAILNDRLVTAKRLAEKTAEADKWHTAHDTLSKAHNQTLKQNTILMEEQHLALHVVRLLGTGTLRESDFQGGSKETSS